MHLASSRTEVDVGAHEPEVEKNDRYEVYHKTGIEQVLKKSPLGRGVAEGRITDVLPHHATGPYAVLSSVAPPQLSGFGSLGHSPSL